MQSARQGGSRPQGGRKLGRAQKGWTLKVYGSGSAFPLPSPLPPSLHYFIDSGVAAGILNN